jgi:16S rRNA processing protein RimM
MTPDFLEAGRVVNTHGVHGDIRLEPWCDAPEFLLGVPALYLGADRPLAVERARVHKSFVLLKLKGVDDVPAAQALKGKILLLRRADAVLPEGRYCVRDLIGLEVRDEQGGPVGTLHDILPTPRHDVYVVRGEDSEAMIPNVPAFVKNIDMTAGVITVSLIEGMQTCKSMS